MKILSNNDGEGFIPLKTYARISFGRRFTTA
jgi:hypothetical protein